MRAIITSVIFGLTASTPVSGQNGLVHLALSADAKFIATVTEDELISVRENHNIALAKHQVDPIPHQCVWALAFDPTNNENLFYATGRGLYIWEWKAGARPRELLSNTDAEGNQVFNKCVHAIVASPNGKYIGMLDSNQRALIVETGPKRKEPRVSLAQEAQDLALGEIFSVKYGTLCFSPDSSIIAQTARNEIVLFDIKNRKEIRRLKGHTDTVGSLCFIDDHTLLSASWDGACRIWNTKKGEGTIVPLGAKGESCPLTATASDGKRFVCACDDGIYVFSFPDRKEIKHIPGPKSGFTGIAFLKDSRYLVSTGEAPDHKIWDIQEGREVQRK